MKVSDSDSRIVLAKVARPPAMNSSPYSVCVKPIFFIELALWECCSRKRI